MPYFITHEPFLPRNGVGPKRIIVETAVKALALIGKLHGQNEKTIVLDDAGCTMSWEELRQLAIAEPAALTPDQIMLLKM